MKIHHRNKFNLEKVHHCHQLYETDIESKLQSQFSYRNKSPNQNNIEPNFKKIVDENKCKKELYGTKNSLSQVNCKTPRNETPKTADCSMSDTEKKIYGDRTPKNYAKISILGRGGCALVWLAKNLQSDMVVALKQFPKSQGSISSAKVEELIFANLNNVFNKNHVGNESISHLIDTIDDRKDVWLVYEVGGDSLSKALFNVKGEFHKGERIYFIHHQDLYHTIKSNKNVLRQLLRKLFEAFDLLHKNGIVHADLKSDNVLVTFNDNQITDVKVIDFGSAFLFETAKEISMSTPEYLAPEILSYLHNRNKAKYKEGVMSVFKTMNISSYDMWSIGALLLEIVTGFPLWLSLKGRTKTLKGKQIFGTGVFGVAGRDCGKILKKQKGLINKDLVNSLKKYDTKGYEKDADFMDLLKNLLEFCPSKRISAREALNHPFLNSNEEN